MKRSILDIPSVEKNRILEMHKKSAKLITEQGDSFPYATTMLDNPDYTTTTTTENKVVEPVGDVVNIKDRPKDEELPYLELNKVEKVDQNIPQTIILAKEYVGKPYVYGSQGPNSFDCSGFVRFLLSKTGKIESVNDIKKIPRTASGIKSSPNVIEIKEEENVKPKNVKPGDFVFFKSGSKISHIGLISNVDIENNKLHMVHASSSQGVQDTEKVYKEGFNKNSYWGPKIAGYGRLA